MNLVCAGFTGSRAAQANQIANDSTKAATNLNNVRMEYSILDDRWQPGAANEGLVSEFQCQSGFAPVPQRRIEMKFA